MAGTVKHTDLSTRTARSKLPRGRQPHWQALVRGRVHLGYQRWKGEPVGRWVLRRYIGEHQSANGKPVGRYSLVTLGRADDVAGADNIDVLSFEQAEKKARTMVDTSGAGKATVDDASKKTLVEKTAVEKILADAEVDPFAAGEKIENITVRQAMALYIAHLDTEGRTSAVNDVTSRSRVHILPALGNLVVANLTADQLRKWRSMMAKQPAQSRPKGGKPNYREAPDTDDARRARKASANRVLTMLRAALNHAFREGHVASDKEWRRVEPFEDVETARIRYLKVAEAQRLLNASDAEFRPLVRAALETGCRYSELARLEVHDFNPEAGTVHIRKSKTGKARHVTLTPEGSEIFDQHCAGRSGNEIMFKHADGRSWEKSEQSRPMQEACERAKIKPRVTFHALRHTWASLAVMANVPLLVVAKNLGHRDTRMVERHYGHLAKSYITEAIHAGAPRFGTSTPSTVTPMPAPRGTDVGKSKHMVK